jgi:O-antigen ligase
MTLLNQETSYKIYRYFFPALAFVMPIHDKLVPPLILLIAINWLLELNFSEKLRNFKNQKLKKYLLLPLFLYLLYVIGTFYSAQLKGPSGALFDLEVKLSMLLFPVFFMTIDLTKFRNDFSKMILKAFIYGCLVSSIILINKAMMGYFKNQDASVFYYTGLSWMHHPSYIALYFTFAIAILLTWILKKSNPIIFKRNLAIMLIIHFQIFIVLLSSKAGIIGFFTTLILIIVYYFIRHREKLKFTLIITGIILSTFVVILFIFPASINRFYAIKKSIEDNQIPDNLKTESSASRLLVWECSLEIIQENFLFGVGTGDVKTELIKKYNEKQIVQALAEKLNPHNQFLQTFIAIGLTGFILLIVGLLYPSIYAYKKENLLFILFIGMFLFHILVESMLERQAGVVFYAFFYVLLLFSPFPDSDKSDSQLPEI